MIIDIDPFDIASLTKAEKQINDFKASISRKMTEVIRRLALEGKLEAESRFSTAQYDGDNDVVVYLNPIPGGYSIEAKGITAAFIEFGTGVYHNPSGVYPLRRPEGVVGIGEYGHGRGKNRGWVYKGNPGTNGIPLSKGRVLTHGNPAAMPLWYARACMLRNLGAVTREVFANDQH